MRWKRLSIKTRVAAWIALFVVLTAGLAMAVILRFARETLWMETEKDLREYVTEFSDEIEISAFGECSVNRDSLFENDVIFSIYNDNGELIEGSVPSSFPGETVLKNGVVQRITSGSWQWLTYDVALTYGDAGYIWVRGITYTSMISWAERVVVVILLVLFPVLVILAALGGYLITKHAFAPVEQIRKTAEEIQRSGNLSERVKIGETGGELYELSRTFNGMLDSLEQSFENEKQFTADASHELRTPVSVIISQSEYGLLKDVSEEERRDVIEVVLGQAKKMSAMISQMLMMARNKGQERAKEKVDLGEAARLSADELSEKAMEKRIQIDVHTEDDVCIQAETTAILRIFGNLIENAIQYGKEDGHIWVDVYKEQGRAVCAVKDDGIGIDKKDQEKIFRRFYRADKARTSDDDGHTGLGLAMVKMLAENYGGTVTVESERGEGAEFKVIF